MINLEFLLNKEVDRIILKIWPPMYEKNNGEIDISLGIVFKLEPDLLYIISTNKEDLSSPSISFEKLHKNIFSYETFDKRMAMWMNLDTEVFNLDYEYYDFTDSEHFKKIINSKIISVKLLYLEKLSNPFGLKLFFSDDYIISTPISDGNTIETTTFNRNNNIKVFEHIGKVICK